MKKPISFIKLKTELSKKLTKEKVIMNYRIDNKSEICNENILEIKNNYFTERKSLENYFYIWKKNISNIKNNFICWRINVLENKRNVLIRR